MKGGGWISHRHPVSSNQIYSTIADVINETSPPQRSLHGFGLDNIRTLFKPPRLTCCVLPYLQSPSSPLYPFYSTAPCVWLLQLILKMPSARSPGKHLMACPWRVRESQEQVWWPSCHRSRRVIVGHICVWFARPGAAMTPFSPSTWTWLLTVRLKRKAEALKKGIVCSCFCC